MSAVRPSLASPTIKDDSIWGTISTSPQETSLGPLGVNCAPDLGGDCTETPEMLVWPPNPNHHTAKNFRKGEEDGLEDFC